MAHSHHQTFLFPLSLSRELLSCLAPTRNLSHTLQKCNCDKNRIPSNQAIPFSAAPSKQHRRHGGLHSHCIITGSRRCRHRICTIAVSCSNTLDSNNEPGSNG